MNNTVDLRRPSYEWRIVFNDLSNYWLVFNRDFEFIARDQREAQQLAQLLIKATKENLPPLGVEHE